tara:strand:- start:26685 stop:27320 length:636 start_codon:yes stop_codon:yes gene_type:complete
MKKSPMIDELAIALCKAQSEMGGAVKDAKNPFFKSSYADLTSVIKAIKEPFANNGLSYVQFPITSEGGRGIGVKTILMHTSGQFLSEEFYLPTVKQDPQSGGSCITYARRYALQAMAGIPTADDDAESAMLRVEAKEPTVEDLCRDAVTRNRRSVKAIKEYLSDPTDANIALAREAFSEITEEDQMAMWKAPTKVSTAPFTTEERKLLKGV